MKKPLENHVRRSDGVIRMVLKKNDSIFWSDFT